MSKPLTESACWRKLACMLAEKPQMLRLGRRGTGLCGLLERNGTEMFGSVSKLMKLRLDRHTFVQIHDIGEAYVDKRGKSRPRVITCLMLALEAQDDEKKEKELQGATPYTMIVDDVSCDCGCAEG